MKANEKQIEKYREIQAQAYKNGSGLGFTEAQLRFIIETATMMAQIMVMAPPVDEAGKPMEIKFV
jgi:hypothetical protein